MHDRPSGRLRLATRRLLAALSLVGVVTLSSSPFATARAQNDETTVPAPAEVDSTEVDSTQVDSTQVPETAPEETEPADTTATTIGASGGFVGAEPDPDVGDVALAAIVGLVLVLGVAAWWMVRRDDERPVPDPPPPSGELL